MLCSCGGETKEHTVQRQLVKVCEYQKCRACGRQHVTWGEFPIEPGTAVPLAEVMAKQTRGGGWTRVQLARWDVPWPPPKGWLRELTNEAPAEIST